MSRTAPDAVNASGTITTVFFDECRRLPARDIVPLT
jgi:hypothetical protein